MRMLNIAKTKMQNNAIDCCKNCEIYNNHYPKVNDFQFILMKMYWLTVTLKAHFLHL